MRGGALNTFFSSVLINGSTFDGNLATSGGAIYAEASNVTIDGNTFTNNSAFLAGAAINVNNVTLTVIDSKFPSNYGARVGAAIYSRSSPSIQIIASSFTDNVALTFLLGVGGVLCVELCLTISVLNSSFLKTLHSYSQSSLHVYNVIANLITCSLNQHYLFKRLPLYLYIVTIVRMILSI